MNLGTAPPTKATQAKVVFESPVQSGFLVLRGLNHNCDQSAFSQKLKRPNQTTKRPQTTFFVVFRPVSVCTGFNWFMTGL
jgi:hypothetical protein